MVFLLMILVVSFVVVFLHGWQQAAASLCRVRGTGDVCNSDVTARGHVVRANGEWGACHI